MRLIDANALKVQLQREIDMYYNEDSGGIHTSMEALDEIDNAPTVDAIPVSWLTAQAENPSNSDSLRNAIDHIVYSMWAERKEE